MVKLYKIHIIGSVASGKTTLARTLSSKLEIPYYELDNVAWKRDKSGDTRRTEQERENDLHTIVNLKSWVIEGVHYEAWTNECFQKADIIIFLDTPYTVRTLRIITRFVKQKAGVEKANYKPTLSIFFKMFKWNAHFEKKSKPLIMEKLRSHEDKLYVITSGIKGVDGKDRNIFNHFNTSP
ncbi:DNA topology modulation protein FlaR [Halobacillus sp. A5]|uniref:DNA topology modulation protein FlaR n=1 Tax=Halobacillus sp. A5 TaxID=2880263 RepID=UPI0020A6870C|nr:DNA topology modulation protein FlaR [Halobacillus sp. A5]MCP3026457.1 DNA topology modulation protein FlaR [Halobacillus sp. A5]